MFFSDNSNEWRNYVKYSTAIFSAVVILMLAVWGGVKTDEYFLNFSPWGKVCGAIAGISLAIFAIIKQIKNEK